MRKGWEGGGREATGMGVGGRVERGHHRAKGRGRTTWSRAKSGGPATRTFSQTSLGVRPGGSIAFTGVSDAAIADIAADIAGRAACPPRRAGRSEGARTDSDTQTIRQSSPGRLNNKMSEVGTSAPSSSRGGRRIRVRSVPSPGLVAARRRTHPARTRGRSSRVPMEGDVEMSAVRLTTSAREEESDGACLFARPFDPAAPASSRRVLPAPARSPSTPRPTRPVPSLAAQAASRASRSLPPARVAPAAARPPRRRRPSPFRRTPPSFASSPPPRSSPTSS